MAWTSILHRVLSSNEIFRLSVAECIELYNEAPLHQLMEAAHHRRLQHNPNNEVTYLVDRNINYTNVCTINCQFCSFYRPPGHEETYTQSYEEIHSRIEELEAIGGSRILMTRWTIERTELTINCTDIRVIDVAINKVSHFIVWIVL